MGGGVRLLSQAAEAIGIDPHWKHTDTGFATRMVNDRFFRRAVDDQIEQLAGCDSEMASVGGGVEPNQVRAQQAFEDTLPGRQHTEYFEGWERDVEEEADPRAGDSLPKQRGNPHQLVVVNPDEITRPVELRQAVREARVDGLVGIPVARTNRKLVDQIVTQRPQHAIGVTDVEAPNLGQREVDWHAAESLELSVQHAAVNVTVIGSAGPTHPRTATLHLQGTQSGRYSTYALSDPRPVRRLPDGDRQPHRGQNKSWHACSLRRTSRTAGVPKRAGRNGAAGRERVGDAAGPIRRLRPRKAIRRPKGPQPCPERSEKPGDHGCHKPPLRLFPYRYHRWRNDEARSTSSVLECAVTLSASRRQLMKLRLPP